MDGHRAGGGGGDGGGDGGEEHGQYLVVMDIVFTYIYVSTSYCKNRRCICFPLPVISWIHVPPPRFLKVERSMKSQESRYLRSRNQSQVLSSLII